MRADTDIGGTRDEFPVTHHSAVRDAGGEDAAARTRGLAEIIAGYWKPIYKYLRVRWGASVEEAKDLTQGFFSRALEKDFFAKYDAEKAAFRTYLRVCLDGFVANERQAAARLKRGGAARVLSLDFGAADDELRLHPAAPADAAEPDAFFHREWIRELFATSVETLREHCRAAGKDVHFTIFERYDLQERDAGGATLTYESLAGELGLPVTQVTNHLAWARREFRRITLEALRRMTGSDAEFREEARALFGSDIG